MTKSVIASWAVLCVLPLGLSACSSESDDLSAPNAGGAAQGGAAGSGGEAGSSGAGGVAGSSGAAGEAGVGGTGGEGGSGQGGAGGTGGSVSEACAALHSGLNEGFMVDGIERSFLLTLPDDAQSDGPWPVVFNWHGLGDTAANMNTLVAGQVNRADFPFIAVTPEDTDFMVSAMGMSVSMDWDVFDVGDGSTNREVRLFDEVMSCLEARFPIDAAHIHTMGFSIGGIVSDLLGVVRGGEIASIATYSGAYFSTPDNVESLGLLKSIGISWPQPGQDAYPQLLLHGGDNDVWSPGAGVQVRFNVFADNDTTALTNAGHDVVLCNHGKGHTAPPPEMPGSRLVDFFRDNPLGTTASPYRANGLPDNFAAYCELRPATPK